MIMNGKNIKERKIKRKKRPYVLSYPIARVVLTSVVTWGPSC